MKQLDFFNTTNEGKEKESSYILKAKGQNNIIMGHFLKNPHLQFTPSEIWINLFNVDETPLTSIRRSLNTLTKKGNLKKLELKKTGIYGRPEYHWKLNK